MAVFTRSRVTPDDTVLVEGPGPIGSLIAMVADAMGATVVVSGVDRDETVRLPTLDALGIVTTTMRPSDLAEHRDALTGGNGFDCRLRRHRAQSRYRDGGRPG